MARVDYIHHRNVEFKEFTAPSGMVGQWTTEKAAQVAAHAIRIAPKPGQAKYATGELARNIKPQPAKFGRRGPEAEIHAGTDHAVFVHEGTRPHIIKAKPKSKMVFFLRSVGRAVYADVVKHPGTPANPFLVKALRAVFGGPGR